MCRNTSGCLPYLIIKGIMDSGKKKFDPRSIDEKAILDIVARKGTIRPDSPATSVSPKPEDTAEEIAGSSEAPVFTTGEIDAYRASFLNTVRTKSRKSLHIDADLHRRISSLVWAVGRGEVTVAGFVRQGSRIADVGTDHGYIPVYLAQTGRIASALAMDVRPGPLERAQAHVRDYEERERARRQDVWAVPIHLRLSDGLKELKPGEADTVIIAGMGGELIIKILDEGRHVWDSVKQYVLSPQSDLDKVRRYLAAHGFAIEDEAMVKDEGKYYTVMSVKRGFMEYESQAHYLYGKILIDKKDVILREYLGREMLRIEKILVSLQAKDGITDTETRAEARISRQKELSWIKEAQDEMQ